MRLKIFLNDVALREGAQVAGGNMTIEDQLTYVRYLVKYGIDRIEIGYPSTKEPQIAQCKKIVQFVQRHPAVKKPMLSALARAVKEDIDSVKEVGCEICHIYIPTSDELLLAMFGARKFGGSKEEKQQFVLEKAIEMVRYAKGLGFKLVEYSPEDAARCGFDYLKETVTAVIDAGADVVNIPDTTGLRIGTEFGDLIRRLFLEVPNIGHAQISAHCHNDSDHSTSNALQAILAGAVQVEGTFYGLGERSGMTKFESVLMNVRTRQDVFADYEIGFNEAGCVEIVNFLGGALGMPVPRHWAVVGRQNSVCNSGTHQAVEARAKKKGMDSAYYSWDPPRYGHASVNNEVNISSGKEGIRAKLNDFGFQTSKDHLEVIARRCAELSNAKHGRPLKDRELTAIVEDVIREIPFPIIVKRCQAIGGKGTIKMASVVVEVNDAESPQVSKTGNGTFNAIHAAIIEAASHFHPVLKNIQWILEDCRFIPITSESESLADFYTQIGITFMQEKKSFAGRAVDEDTIQAAAESFAKCLSWFLAWLNGR
ncbi:MAG: alpha-isopropylmalate synthase regulatory domain-containing protein [Candidatus Margulisiibacteriota bacterium]